MALESSYCDFRIVGKGSFAVVFAAKNIQTGHRVAVKCSNFEEGNDEHIKREKNAFNMLESHRHENIIIYYDSWFQNLTDVRDKQMHVMLDACKANANSNQILCIAMELCDGSLSSYLRQRNKEFFTMTHVRESDENSIRDGRSFDDDQRRDQLVYFEQICNGIDFLHSKNVVHRALNPRNILFMMKNGTRIFKITDYGLSKLYESSFPNTQCGIMFYSAPEQLTSTHYGLSVDIYSLGIILLELLYPVTGVMDLQAVFKAIKKDKKFPAELKQIYPQLADLILRMIDIAWKTRPSLKEVIAIIDQERSQL